WIPRAVSASAGEALRGPGTDPWLVPEWGHGGELRPSRRAEQLAREAAKDGTERLFARRVLLVRLDDLRDRHRARDALQHVLLRFREAERFDADGERNDGLDGELLEGSEDRLELLERVSIADAAQDEIERIEAERERLLVRARAAHERHLATTP